MAFSALSAGVSGLQAFSDGVGVIADNITNVNTVGYKETRSRFVTLVTETNTLTSFSPGGVQAQTQTLVSRQGLLQASASETDLAIDGSGFFPVREPGPDNPLLFTRAGSFTTDEEGNFINAAGFNLLGFRLNSDGEVITIDGTPDPNPSARQDATNLQTVNVNNLNLIGEPTSQIELRVNLQSSSAQQLIAPRIGGEIINGTDGTNTIVPDFETSFQIFDSRGGARTLTLQAVKISPSEWAYDIAFTDPSDLSLVHRNAANGGTANADGLIGFGTLAFLPDGSLDLTNSDLNEIITTGSQPVALDPTTNLFSGLDFTYAAVTAPGSVDSTLSPGSLSFDFGTDAGLDGFTSFDSPSTLLSANVDGALLGDVNGVSIRENGDVEVIFDNGETIIAFQVPVATFQNPDGLERLQGNAFGASNISGQVTLQTAGAAGSGNISANSLEQSTVDLANEFAELIRVQRAFSASTRIISTSDEILEELTRL